MTVDILLMRFRQDINRAREFQNSLKEKVRILPLERSPRYIAGVDASASHNKIIGVASLFSFPELMSLEDSYEIMDVSFPYIPGFLSFREGPAIIGALRKLKRRPDVILADGQGIAHPRSAGIASHIGVLLDIPAIGCAKSRLVGVYQEPGKERGDRSSLLYGGAIVGAVLTTRRGVRPLFVSAGHRITREESVEIVLHCANRFRLPEPLRRADHISRELRRGLVSSSVA
jgi:deoxyribonuclease V